MDAVNPFYFFLTAGVVLIAIELLILQLTVFWLLFIGFGALISAVVAWFMPEASWLLTTTVFVFSSATISFILYSPLKRWQQRPGSIAGNDAIGKSVEIIAGIEANKKGKVIWSGTKWNAVLAGDSEPLVPGDTGVIVSIDGIELTVRSKK